MIFLIYGKNGFLIAKKKSWFRKNIYKDRGNIEIRNFNFLDNEWDEFLNFLKNQSIFLNEKLIFVENLSSFKEEDKIKEFFKNRFEALNKDKKTSIVFIENNFKNKFIAFLVHKGVKKYYFEPFSCNRGGKEYFIKYFIEYTRNLGGEISQEALKLLGDFFDCNGWLVESEIKKLIILGNKKIDANLVKKYCLPKYLSNELFSLAESVLSRNKKMAIFIIKKLIYWGEDESKIFNMLLWQIKNFVRIKFLKKSDLKFKSFYINKIRRLSHNVSEENLKRIYKILANIDLRVKTSRLNYREALMDFFREI